MKVWRISVGGKVLVRIKRWVRRSDGEEGLRKERIRRT